MAPQSPKFSLIKKKSTKGGAHAKQAVSPGISSCICPETASSDTPAQNSFWVSKLIKFIDICWRGTSRVQIMHTRKSTFYKENLNVKDHWTPNK